MFFFSSLCNIKEPFFSPRKGHSYLVLSLSLCFSSAFFGLPLFQFLFLCLSLSCSFLCFFLLVFFLLSFGSFFLSLFCPFVSSLLLFHEKNNIKSLIAVSFFIDLFLFFFGFLSCFSFKSLFLSLFFVS